MPKLQYKDLFSYALPEVSRSGRSSFRLTNEIVVGCPLDEVFDFCRDTRYLNQISPPLLHFQPRNDPEVDVKIAAGTEIEYDMRLHGVPVRWRSRIPLLEPPHRFVDEQLIGPYLHWSHLHTFEALDDDNTLIGDVVDYKLPGGTLISNLAQFLFVKRDLVKVFSHRSRKYREFLGYPIRR